MKAYCFYTGDGTSAVVVAHDEAEAMQLLASQYWNPGERPHTVIDLTVTSVTTLP